MATSSAPSAAPKKKTLTKRNWVEPDRIAIGVRIGYAMPRNAVGGREPNRAMAAPVSGMVITAPIAMVSSARPNTDGSMSSRSLTIGM